MPIKFLTFCCEYTTLYKKTDVVDWIGLFMDGSSGGVRYIKKWGTLMMSHEGHMEAHSTGKVHWLKSQTVKP